MNMLRVIAVLCCVTLVIHAADTPGKVAFARGRALYVANLDGSGVKKIVAGACPNVSPDGTRLAYNTESAKGPERSIAIADVGTGKSTVLKGVPSNNSYGPVWSPDGALLIFNTMAGSDWRLGIIGSDGAHFRYFTPKAPTGGSLYSFAWAPDSQSFYAQDLDALYHFALDGTLMKKWNIAKLIAGASFSSASQFSVSPDGHTLLIDTEMDENITRKDWDGPPPAIWAFDLETTKAVRLTAKGTFAWTPVWVSEGEFICAMQLANAKDASIYRVSIDGKQRDLLIKNANSPSVSR